MTRDRRRAWSLGFVAIACGVLGTSCGPGREKAAGPPTVRAGVTQVDAAGVPSGGARGVIYVPVYSHVYTDDAGREFLVAVTLAVRNTDASAPRFLTSVKYIDTDGRLVREYAPGPLRVAPLAAAEFFVPQSDTRGGSSASFLIEWAAEPAGAGPPMAEALMIGTATNQVVSFTSQGRPVPPPADARP